MRQLRLPAVLITAWLLAGCPASSDEVKPPPDEFYFPTGLVVDPTETDLYVVNANSDLRFDSGVVSVASLEAVSEMVEAWASGEIAGGRDCAADQSFPLTLICDERGLIDPTRSVRIGNFATEAALQVLASGLRLFIAVRGDPSLTYVDIPSSGAALSCGSGEFHECDEAHRLVSIRDSDDLPNIPDEPFGVYVDSANGFAMTTHLSNGAVSLADAPPDGSAPILADAVAGIFSPGPQTLLPGAVGVAGRLPGSADDRVYVTSRTDSRIQTLLVSRIAGQSPQLVAGEFFFLNTVLPSSDSRDIAFSSDGNRAFVVNRDPPTLQIIDTSLGPTGVPVNDVDAAVELCRQASTVAVVEGGRGTRVYVACFLDGEVWVIDPVGRSVESIISVGRGPQFLAVAEARGLLFVSNFRENTVAVVDIRPGSLTENRVVLRIGRPGETEGVE